MRELKPCGTVAAYMRHLKSGDPACDDCRQAWSAYQREYRTTHPRNRGRESRNASARSRAMWRLRKEFPKRFLELYEEELRAGVTQ